MCAHVGVFAWGCCPRRVGALAVWFPGGSVIGVLVCWCCFHDGARHPGGLAVGRVGGLVVRPHVCVCAWG